MTLQKRNHERCLEFQMLTMGRILGCHRHRTPDILSLAFCNQCDLWITPEAINLLIFIIMAWVVPVQLNNFKHLYRCAILFFAYIPVSIPFYYTDFLFLSPTVSYYSLLYIGAANSMTSLFKNWMVFWFFFIDKF